LERITQQPALKHLYGEHFYYEKRYPGGLFGTEPSDLANDALVTLRYERAAEYGAHVLLMAANLLDAQKEPAFLVFTSDHGENLPTDGTGKRYHAGPSSGKFDTIVPALVLWNQAFADTGNPALLNNLLKAKGLIAHRDVAKAWLTLSGMPGDLHPTPNPMTWGARRPGEPVGVIACSMLGP
jgi:glucan phosphoethanolaminetransferase (alkaline phosphatase superfamily)